MSVAAILGYPGVKEPPTFLSGGHSFIRDPHSGMWGSFDPRTPRIAATDTESEKCYSSLLYNFSFLGFSANVSTNVCKSSPSLCSGVEYFLQTTQSHLDL